MIATDDTTTTDITEESAVDPEAPFGRKLDGSPKRAPGGRPPRGKRAPSRSGPAAPPRRKTSSSTRPSKTDYTPGLVGVISLAALPLKFAGLELDAAALLIHGPELAEAVNTTAQERTEVAALCDRLLQVGPYGLIIGAVMKLGAQIAENHGFLPSSLTTKLGAIPRDHLAVQLGAMVEQAEAEAAGPVHHDVNGAPMPRWQHADSVA